MPGEVVAASVVADSAGVEREIVGRDETALELIVEVVGSADLDSSVTSELKMSRFTRVKNFDDRS